MTTASPAPIFTGLYSFSCYWKLNSSSSNDIVSHIGSCSVGRKGDTFEVAFTSKVCRKPKIVRLSGNIRSFTDGRPKKTAFIVALHSNNPNMITIDRYESSLTTFERFVSLVKELRSASREVSGKHLLESPRKSPGPKSLFQWSPQSPKSHRLSFLHSPSLQNSRGRTMLQEAKLRNSEPPQSNKQRSFYKSSLSGSPNRSLDLPASPKRTHQDVSKTRRLLLMPAAQKTMRDDDFETPLMKKPKLNHMTPNVYRSLNFDTSKGQTPEAQLNGLTNLGNTCYMNAILQSLLSLDSLAKDISHPDIQRRVKPKSMYQLLYLLLKSISHNEPIISRIVLLRQLKSLVGGTSEQFAGYMENDAHEFLSKLFNQLLEEWESLPPLSEGDPGKLLKSPVVNNFHFSVQTTIRCKNCDNVRFSNEAYFDLPLYLPIKMRESYAMSPIKMQYLMNAFFEDEVIDCKCDKCDHSSSVLCRHMQKLPRVLVIQLKRCQFDLKSGKFYKISDAVTLPALIDLGSYCKLDTEAPPALTSEEKENVNLSEKRTCGEAVYRLMSVVSHSGDAYSGHYVSDVYSLKEGSWQSCNDSAIFPTTEEDVRITRQKTGYVLFYMHQSIFQDIHAKTFQKQNT